VTRGQLPQRAGSLGLNGGGAAAARQSELQNAAAYCLYRLDLSQIIRQTMSHNCITSHSWFRQILKITTHVRQINLMLRHEW